jgi:hypothetical protein
MSEPNSYDVVFFFGAGASAPFGIPTMKQLVHLFETDLQSFAEATAELGLPGHPTPLGHEIQQMYKEIKKSLETKLPNKTIDLEAIFTVINGIIDYKLENLGPMSLYAISALRQNLANQNQKLICLGLREQFEDFIKLKCSLPEIPFPRTRLGEVYQDFFNRFALILPSANTFVRKGNYCWSDRWTLFTTNYDLCLEYYWYDRACSGIDLAFEDDRSRRTRRMVPSKHLSESIGIRLCKLHGSVNWQIDRETGDIIEQDMALGESLLGRQYAGEMMIYPVAEKQLYLDPYISMLLRLNRELEQKRIWVVIGYSFNDPIIQTIFLKKSTPDKHLVLLHPDAQKIYGTQLHEFRGKKSLINRRFGLDDFREVNHSIIQELTHNTRTYDAEHTAMP